MLFSYNPCNTIEVRTIASTHFTKEETEVAQRLNISPTVTQLVSGLRQDLKSGLHLEKDIEQHSLYGIHVCITLPPLGRDLNAGISVHTRIFIAA